MALKHAAAGEDYGTATGNLGVARAAAGVAGETRSKTCHDTKW